MDALKFINDQMAVIGIPYEFGEWSSDVTYPYFVGEFTDIPTDSEDGYTESQIILNGFTRGSLITLEDARAKIRKHFDQIYGLRAQTEDGSISVFYNGSNYVPTGEAELKKIEITLLIKRWKGDFT